MNENDRKRTLYILWGVYATLAVVMLSLFFGCAAQRYTMEQYWPAGVEEPGVIVIQWPEGVEPGMVETRACVDPITETTRTLSAAPWTLPPEPQ